MALSKKTVPVMDISSQLSSMNSMNSGEKNNVAEETPVQQLKQIPEPAPVTNYIPAAEPPRRAAKAKPKKEDTSAIIGFKIQKEAKAQYQEFFAEYGMNLSEATKNALEYFIQDLQAGKIEITLTHHFIRVEE